jgi:tetratricopeptide (TPR) repeat protein
MTHTRSHCTQVCSGRRDSHCKVTLIPTRTHLDYAQGYLGLNLLAEAKAELALIRPEDRDAPEVLALHLELAMATGAWMRVIALAKKLSAVSPADERPWIAWAYALREKQRIAEARDVLLRGESAIDGPSALVDYNLACYFSLLGNLPEAPRRLKRACLRNPDWKTEALTDPDLAPLHPQKPVT